jgi:protein required for attachment to host cells
MHLKEVKKNTKIYKVKFKGFIIIEHPRHYGPLREITKNLFSHHIQIDQVIIIWY